MASGELWNVVTTGSTTTNTVIPWTVTTGGGSGGTWYGVAGGGAGGYIASESRPQTALEWLDAEVEAVCKLARQAA